MLRHLGNRAYRCVAKHDLTHLRAGLKVERFKVFDGTAHKHQKVYDLRQVCRCCAIQPCLQAGVKLREPGLPRHLVRRRCANFSNLQKAKTEAVIWSDKSFRAGRVSEDSL